MAKHHPISARTHGSSQQGLSLLDLVAGIAVAFVLCFLAFPSQHQLLSRYRTLAHAQELTQLLLYARGEAIRRGSRITAPSSRPRPIPTPPISPIESWEHGWHNCSTNSPRERLRFK